MVLKRHPQNPLIRPQDVKPSRPDFEVTGAFNCGATLMNNEVILLLRVAERPNYAVPGVVLCPHLNGSGELVISEISRLDEHYDFNDARFVMNQQTSELWLTSISHLRLARSYDGVHFTIEDKPWLQAEQPLEGFGVEDARITRIGDCYYVNYTAVSRHGIATGLASTFDFQTVQREGIIFPPSNRDVVIFPQQINGLYVCYHRPMPGMFGGYHIWMATSPDLKHWGQHQVVLEAKPNGWEAGRVGGGAPPIYTEAGWLSIYHAADQHDRYCLGAFLTSHDQPERVIGYSLQPIFSPQAPYETNGFFGNVVFTCGAFLQNDLLRVYYGAADESVALAEIPLLELLDGLAMPQITPSRV